MAVVEGQCGMWHCGQTLAGQTNEYNAIKKYCVCVQSGDVGHIRVETTESIDVLYLLVACCWCVCVCMYCNCTSMSARFERMFLLINDVLYTISKLKNILVPHI